MCPAVQLQCNRFCYGHVLVICTLWLLSAHCGCCLRIVAVVCAWWIFFPSWVSGRPATTKPLLSSHELSTARFVQFRLYRQQLNRKCSPKLRGICRRESVPRLCLDRVKSECCARSPPFQHVADVLQGMWTSGCRIRRILWRSCHSQWEATPSPSSLQ